MFIEMSGIHEGEPFADAIYYCGVDTESLLRCTLSGASSVGSVPAEFSGAAAEEFEITAVCTTSCNPRIWLTSYSLKAQVFDGQTLSCVGRGVTEFPSSHSGGTAGPCTLK